jgi:hypothetical protein
MYHQLGYGYNAHFIHHAAAMGLNRTYGGTEFSSDLFVEEPGYYQPHDFELSWRKLRKSCAAFCEVATLLPVVGRARQRLRYSGEQFVIAKRLWQEVDCAAFHCTDPHRYVTVTGNEDDLLQTAFLSELFLEGGAIKSR